MHFNRKVKIGLVPASIEILAGELAGAEPINSHAVTYLNRLSDWFFVAGRIANDDGAADVLWVPGANR